MPQSATSPQDKKGGGSKSRKSNRSDAKPEWNDCISDLSKLKASAEQLERKKLICKSKNAEIAKMDLVKRRLQRQKLNEELKKEKAHLIGELLYESDQLIKAFDVSEDGLRDVSKSLPNPSSALQSYGPNTDSPRRLLNQSNTTNSQKIANTGIDKLVSPRVLSHNFSTKNPKPFINSDNLPTSRLNFKFLSQLSGDNNIRMDTLNQILCNLFRALNDLEKKITNEVVSENEHPPKPVICKATTLNGFTEGLLSVFCKLVQLFQRLASELDKVKEQREELRNEVSRQGTLLEELSVELMQLDTYRSKGTEDKKDVAAMTVDSEASPKSSCSGSTADKTGNRGPETCLMNRATSPSPIESSQGNGERPTGLTSATHSMTSTKTSLSLPDFRELCVPKEGKHLSETGVSIEREKRLNDVADVPVSTASPLPLRRLVTEAPVVRSCDWNGNGIRSVASSPASKSSNSPACSQRSVQYKPWTRVNPECLENNASPACLWDTVSPAVMLSDPEQRNSHGPQEFPITDSPERVDIPGMENPNDSFSWNHFSSSWTTPGLTGALDIEDNEPFIETTPQQEMWGSCPHWNESSWPEDEASGRSSPKDEKRFLAGGSSNGHANDALSFQPSYNLTAGSDHNWNREDDIKAAGEGHSYLLEEETPCQVVLPPANKLVQGNKSLDMKELLSKLEALQHQYQSAQTKLQSLVAKSDTTAN